MNLLKRFIIENDDDQIEFPEENSSEENNENDELSDKSSKIVNTATENPNKQGAIRTVPDADLVYKRKENDGDYEEMWVYHFADMKTALKIRQDILSGTDIKIYKRSSDDGKQIYDMWTTGNTEILKISGLPN